MNYEYQKNNTYFAQAPGMMEELCAAELAELGAFNIQPAYRGVYFEADKPSLYRINYCSRLVSRVLAPIISFPCKDTDDLLRIAPKVAWERIFTLEDTFAITASVAKSNITNSLYAAQCLKDGIADYFRAKTTRRPNVNVSNPDIRFNLHIESDTAVISLDTSGESLHKRGYRLLAGEAPMQETLAAAIIRISNWDGETPLWDCMCGSGTLLCEAFMHYCRIPTQFLRSKFGFYFLPDFDRDVWNKVKSEADSQIRPLPEGLIAGSDRSQIVINTARENLSRLPGSENVSLRCQRFEHVKNFENGTLIANPPYGIRLGELEEVQALYKSLGDFLKTQCKGTNAYIYTGERTLQKYIGLKISKKYPLVNGKLEGILMKIESYEGSRKKKYQNPPPESTAD